MVFGRINGLINRGHRDLGQAELVLELAKALIADVQDGVAVTVHVNDGAAHKIISHFLKGKGGALPLTVAIDPTYDTLPGKVAKFVGGPYDGKSYSVAEGVTEITLEGGAEYKWDGYVFHSVTYLE